MTPASALFASPKVLLLAALFGMPNLDTIVSSSIFAAVSLCVALLVIWLVTSTFKVRKFRTLRLLERALNVDVRNPDKRKLALKQAVVERTLLDNQGVQLTSPVAITEFASQRSCESKIRSAARDAKVMKVLTIRGQKYFFGERSLLKTICDLKTGKGYSMRVLVLSPETDHLTETVAMQLGHQSSDEVRENMQVTLDYLKLLMRLNGNFMVKCYNGTPSLKLLVFDDTMFVSAFLGPKSDDNVRMYQMSRQGNVLFAGLENMFDDLWQRSQLLADTGTSSAIEPPTWEPI